MNAQLFPVEDSLERKCESFKHGNVEYLRFQARPKGMANSTYPAISRMIEDVEKKFATPVPAQEPVNAVMPKPGLMALLSLWSERIKERRQMARDAYFFSDEMLEDLGMNRQQALKIAQTPFWRELP